MKMVKSLLLGSAAGLVAVTAGQAADLPVKAQPVQYVKVCSLYGAGFYYMPGTDTCIKVGGWARMETGYGLNGSSTAVLSTPDLNNRYTSNYWARARAYVTVDAREQTAYGTARGYMDVGISGDYTSYTLAGGTFSSNRAFVQWAGFTAGLTQSFYDFYIAPAASYMGWLPSEDTGDGGEWLWAYTAQFGGGFSATVSAELRRQTQMIDANLAAAGTPLLGATVAGAQTTAGAYGGWQSPDIVANLRLDQAWGSAQVMGVAHEDNGLYYNTTVAGTPIYELSGHPSDAWGYVAGAGLKLNMPAFGVGDYFQGEANYTQGALKYLFAGYGNGNLYLQNGGRIAYGVMTDAVYGTGSSVNLTTGWGFNASYEHYWTPQWHQSLYGNYTAISYGSGANNQLCFDQGFGGSASGTTAATAGCNNNWSIWAVGSRNNMTVTKSMYLGVDVMYGQLNSASTPGNAIGTNTTTGLTTACSTAALCSVASSESNWAIRARMHKDFLP